MPYREIEDLPDGVRRHLPAHAQEIFLAAFNHAWADHAAADALVEKDRRAGEITVRGHRHGRPHLRFELEV